MGKKKKKIETRARVGRIHTATDGRDILINSPDGWEVDRPWLWWDGPSGSDGTGGPWGNPPPGAVAPNWTNVLPAVARCRSLIVDQLAGVPWQVFKDDEQIDTPDWISDPQGLRVDQRIQSSVLNVRHSAVEFWAQILLSCLELGEGVVYVPARNVDGSPRPPLFSIDPTLLSIEEGQYTINGVGIPDEELIIVRNRVLPGYTRGIGVWQQFAQEIGFGSSIRDYATNMLGRGIPAGYLKVSAPDLSQIEADSLKARWMAAHGGSDRKIAVLNAVTEFHPLQLDPQALQLTELMRLNAWQVCMIYGIPPYKIGISMGYNNTYANIESASIDYVQDALLPWARRIESTFDAEFPRGTSIKLNLDGLRRADTKTRFEAYKIALDAHFLTVDEVRQLEDRPPLTAAQEQEIAPPPPVLSITRGPQNDQPAVDQGQQDQQVTA